MKGIANGDAAVTATVTDRAGNPANAGASVLVDTAVPEVTINKVAVDGIINGAEHGQPLLVTGSATNAQAGDKVTVTLNGHDYVTVLDANGNWSIGVPASDVAALTGADYTLTAAVTDKAGNSNHADRGISVDLTRPELTIDTVAGDDIINSIEKGQDLHLTGAAPDLAAGSSVSVTLNGKTYQGEVAADGTWSATVPAADVRALGEARYEITVSAQSEAGNTGSAGHEVIVDTRLPTVIIERIAGDDVINRAEVDAGQTISGRVANAEAGNTVTVTIAGKEYTTTVQSDLSWSVNVPNTDLEALGNGPLSVTATVMNGHGNTGSGERNFTIDANLPGMRIDIVAGDDVINGIEHARDLIVTGSSDGLKAGSAVNVTINGKDYPATVLEDGTWRAAVPKAEVGELAEGAVKVTVSGTNEAGNSMHVDRIVRVDLSEVAISINSVTEDNVLNAVEKGQDLILSGSTSGVEEGREVTISFGDKIYTATVGADHSWSYTVPAPDLAGQRDGSASLQVSVTNMNGNGASAGHDYRVDTLAPAITIDAISGDNMLNAAEAGQPLTISGTSSAEAGQKVTVTFNGRDYPAEVGANGRWTLDVPADDMKGIANGDAQVTATVTDRAGNPTHAGASVLVDTTVPQITFDNVAVDDVINSTEHGQAVMITGNVAGAAPGDIIQIALNGVTYSATVKGDGSWSVGVPAGDVRALAETGHTITATITDKAGNSSSNTHSVTVNLEKPVLTIDPISGDDVINSTEKGQELHLSGKVTGVAEGADVTVNLNGKSYTGKVGAGGIWTATIPAADVQTLGEARYEVSVSASSNAGNTGGESRTVMVDSALPAVIVDRIAGDDVINAAEIASGQNISGRVINAEAGNTVTVTIAGKAYTATVQSDLSWTVNVSAEDLQALGNGPMKVTASVTNNNNNTGGGEREFTIDANLPGIRIDTVAGDDVINGIEHGQALIITGSSDGLKAGAAVTVTLNGKDYAATVLADGTWSAAVPQADVGELAAGAVKVTVAGTNEAGNPMHVDRIVKVDLSDVAISINSVTADNVLNAAEKRLPLELTGTTTNVEAGQTVTIAFGGKIYTTTVGADGGWTCSVPAGDLTGLRDGSASVQVSVANVHGNGASAGRGYVVDTLAPTITIDTVAGDNTINVAEAGKGVVISGTTTAEAGQELTVSFNNHDYKATVGADGRWTITAPAGDLKDLASGADSITVSVSDRAGNAAAADRAVTVDVDVPKVTIDTIAGDDVINSTEHQQPQIITGSATGAAAGDKVTLTIGGQQFTTVLDGNLNWSIGVPANVISGLHDGKNIPVTVSVTDAAGNTGESTHPIEVSSATASLDFQVISGDNILNATEKGEPLVINGTSANLAEGTTVTVTFNNRTYTATTAADGSWSLTVSPADLATLGEANYVLTATAENSIGNRVDARSSLVVDTASPYVIINSIAGDDVINTAEAAQPQTIGGRVVNAVAGNTVTVTIAGKEYTTTVQPDLTWSVSVPSSDWTSLGDGRLNVTASVTNTQGNTGGGERGITVDAHLPGLRIDTVAGDDVINRLERGQDLVVTGSSSDLQAGSVVTVTLNGKDYTATVLADGTWSAVVPKADVGVLSAGALKVTASGTSETGNTVSVDHNVKVDLSSVAITVDSVTDDNVLNAAEKNEPLTLTGRTGNVEAGQTVTVAFGGKVYTATVDADGTWRCEVPAADLASLKEGTDSVQVSVTNAAGNGASAGHDYRVDTVAPTITVDSVTADNVINSNEVKTGVTISGTATAEAGQRVTVTFNNHDYTARVGAGGRWSLVVPGADLKSLTDGTETIVVKVADKAGNEGQADSTVGVDVSVPKVTINTIAGDDIINIAEHQQSQIVSGSVAFAGPGAKVTVTLNGYTYTTAVDNQGNWSVGVPANVIAALHDGTTTVAVSVTDAAGNTGSATRPLEVNSGLPSLDFNAIAEDNVLNAVEKGQDLVISGTSANLKEGTEVTVNFNGKDYTAHTLADGSWTLTVGAADLAALGEATYTLRATAASSIGNSVSTNGYLQVDTASPYVIIDRIAGDDVVNVAEAAMDQVITGRVVNAAADDIVTVTIGAVEYTAVVQPDLSWTIFVPSSDITALGNGDLTATATVTNGHGNVGGGERDFTIDANLPGLRIDPVTGDDVINRIERGEDLVVTGSSSGMQPGAPITVTLNGRDYTATVLADGTWSATIPAADVGMLGAGTVNVTASGTSDIGNTVTIDHPVRVDLSGVAISVNSVTSDNVLNAAEKAQDLVLSGTTANVEAGQKVTIAFGGKVYTTTVAENGTWSYTVAAKDLVGLREGSASVQVSVANVAGNGTSSTRGYTVDTIAPNVSVNPVTADNVINSAEAKSGVMLSGTTTAEAGQSITITLNGHTYTTLAGANGSWKVGVPGADLAGIADGSHDVTVKVADKAGNMTEVTHQVTVDVTAPVVTINTIAGDNVINTAEHQQAQVIGGTASGAAAGDKVTVNIDGHNYVTVVDANGNWSVGVPADVIASLNDGTRIVNVTVTDAAGNVGSGKQEVVVSSGKPSLEFNTIAEDNVLNAVEKGQDLVISGKSANLDAGTTVTVTLNHQDYTAITDADGNWTLTVSAADLAALGEANYTVSARASNGIGNSVEEKANLQVDTSLPYVVINAIAGDDVINAAESLSGQNITGRVVNAAAGDTVTVNIAGKEYSALVQPDLSWMVHVPSTDLQELGNGRLNVTASVTNGHGNTGGGDRDFAIDANMPGLRIDTVAGDDIINSIEHGQALVITGSSDGLKAETAVTVTLNGKDYAATVLADGSWSAAVAKEDVEALQSGAVKVTVKGTSEAGNEVHIDHNVIVDLTGVAISINPVTADNVINAAEKGEDLILSGSTGNVETGREVTLVFGGKSYTTTVGAGGVWSYKVPAADLATLKDGSASVQVSVTNEAGNSASAGHDYRVDTQAPTLAINTLSGDDMLNAAEAGQPLTVSGTSSAEAGQKVTVTLNGRSYTATVGSNGSWTLDVPASHLGALADGSVKVTASVTDKAGNPASADRSLTVDVSEPKVTLDIIAGDNVINSTEHELAQLISGKASGAAAGDKVTVTFGSHTYTTVLNADGYWSVGVPANVISSLTNGDVAVSVSVTDAAGNTGRADGKVTVSSDKPTIRFNDIAEDNILNAVEKGQDLVISGTSTHLAAGTTVTVTLNGKSYTATTAADGSWTLTLKPVDLAGLGEANYVLSATAANSIGNSVEATANLQVDTALPYVIINAIAGDDVINKAEVEAGQNITGRVINAAAGDTVTVIIAGKGYTATVQSDLSWTVNVPSADLTALGDGGLKVTASVTNGHGNTGGGERGFAIDANLPGLRIDTVAGDDVINRIERGQDLMVTGSSDGLKAGSAVTVTINGKDYAGTVLADGTWSAAVPKADVSALGAGKVQVSVAGTSEAGNPVHVTRDVTVDLSDVSISINPVTADNVVNAVEKGQELLLSGSTGNVGEGQKVTIVFGGKTFITTVAADGTWNYKVSPSDMLSLKDGSASVQVSVTNAVGNSASAGREFTVDTAAPTVTVDTVAGDNIINAEEAGKALTLSGTSTAEAGQTVTVTFNKHDYTTTVGADGKWTLIVPAADLAGMTGDSAQVIAKVADKAGNPASATHNVGVDTVKPDVTIDKIAGDNVINTTEHGQAQIISGSAPGAGAGDKVTVTIDGHTYTTVLDADLKWSVGIPASVISALHDGTVTVTVSVTDAAGNVGSNQQNVLVSSGQASLSIADIAVDNVLNAGEKGQDLVISGTSANLNPGTTVTVTLNHKQYTATTANDGSWSLTIAAADLAGLGEANYVVSATASNGIGNSVEATSNLLVDTASPYVIIGSVAGDDVVNAAEVAAGQSISGRVVNAAAGDVVTVTITGTGKEYTAIVQSDLSWTVNMSAADLTALGNGRLSAVATVTNGHGNTGSGKHDFTIDASLPGLRINTVAGDDIINSIEHKQDLIVTGSSDGLKPGSAVTVTLNGENYAATVLADGTWRAAIPKENVGELGAGPIKVLVSGTSEAGNPVQIDHNVIVDLASVAISVDPVTADGVINAAEKAQDLLLTGSTGNVEKGQTVTIAFGGHIYTTTVGAGGVWSFTVPAADLATLKDGSASVQVSVTNAAGNSASAGHDYLVDTVAPAIAINTLSGDDMLNAAEAGQPLTVSGTSSAEAGQKVTVTLNGHSYTATVGSNGSWTLDVPAADLAALHDGSVKVTASVTDRAGNPASADRSLTVDVSVPVVTINDIAGDNVINSTEHSQAQVIGGTATGAAAGDKVTVTIAGHTYTTVLNADGYWSVGVPADVISSLANGDVAVSVSVTDAAGNVGSKDGKVVVSSDAPTITFNDIAQDNILNAVEKGQDLVVSGGSTHLAAGTTVTVTLNGKSYTTTTAADGSWTLTVKPTDLAALGEANYVLSATAANSIGNSASASANLQVDTALPYVIINAIAGDDVMNKAEIETGQSITGRVINAAEGDTVAVTIAGKAYTAKVQADLSWTVNVPSADLTALGDGGLKVTASVTNGHGNTGGGERGFAIDANLPGLRIDTVAGDDVINRIEHGQDLMVTGSSDGLKAGSAVTVTINGKDYAGMVLADGTWSAAVPKADVSALDAGKVQVSVAGTSEAGNPVHITHDVTVDLSDVSISINPVTADNVVNALEKGQELLLSGATGNVGEGRQVTIAFGGKTFTTTVAADGTWSYKVSPSDMLSLKDGSAGVQVSVTNAAGNSASAGREFTVDTVAPGVTINTVAADNIINAEEAGKALTLSGTSSAEAGQTVTVTFNQHDYAATVGADGSWTLDVPVSGMAGLTDGPLNVTAVVADKAGNTTTATRNVQVDVTAPSVTINPVAGDNVINTEEHTQAQVISGTAKGADAGNKVEVTIGTETWTTAVDAKGNWSVGVPASVIESLQDGTVTVNVAVTDTAGNTGHAHQDVLVSSAVAVLTFDAIAGDNILNATEKGLDLLVSGGSANLAAGTKVTVTLNGKEYVATTAENGTWSLTVKAADLAGLGEANYVLTATAKNAIGNSVSRDATLTVDTSAPAVTINTVAGDNVLNGKEVAEAVTVSGTTTAEAGQKITVTLNGHSYETTVGLGGAWSLDIPATGLQGMTDKDYTITASVTNQTGNLGSADRAITVDTTPPVVTFNKVAEDDIINHVEHGQAQIISGKATGTTTGDRVVVSIDGKEYVTTVDASGNWLVGVPADAVAALKDGKTTITATATDSAGNSSSASHEIVVNTASVSITIGTISGDDVINKQEIGSELIIGGTSKEIAEGTPVTVTLNGKNYPATIGADGAWSARVPAADLAAIVDGHYTVSVSVTDSAGNSGQDTHIVSVDTTPPVVSIETISGDDVINAAEKLLPLTIRGASSAEVGQTVTVTLGGKSWTAQVTSNGTWTLDVPADALAALPQGKLTVTATVDDKAGNGGSTTRDITVDTTPPTVTIDKVAGDDAINSDEQKAGQTISGTADAEEGQVVTVTFNGHEYRATVNAAGKWSVNIPGRDFLGTADGTYTIEARVSDKAGNPGGVTRDVTLNGEVPTISINTLSGDDVINAAEHGVALVVSGTTSAPAGQTVTITLNGKSYTAEVMAGGAWSCTVGSADVAALADGSSYTVNAKVSNAIGNSADVNHGLTVDLTPPSMDIRIDALQNDTGLKGNDFITNDTSVVINGSLTAQLGKDETAQISIDGGKTWIDLTVTGTAWQYADGRTLADGDYEYQVRVVDAAGNVNPGNTQHVIVDTTKPEASTITIDAILQDTGLSSTDFITADKQISLQGTLGAALGKGDHAQISIDGGNTWVDVDVSGTRWTWVDGRTLADGKYNYQLRVIDDAGNVSAENSKVVTIDTVAPDDSKTISFTGISDDTGRGGNDFITNDTSLTINGALGKTLADGEYVQISIDGGNTWQMATVIGNTWKYVDGRTLTDGIYNYDVRVIDAAGNVGAHGSQAVTVDTTPPDATITIDRIELDTGVSDSDYLTSAKSYTLHGSLSKALGAGEFVQITLDGGKTWIDATVAGTQWRYSDVRSLADGIHSYEVRIVDLAGNVGNSTASQDVRVDSTAPEYGIKITGITEDTGSSGSDFVTMDKTLTLHGTLDQVLAKDEHAQISLDGGKTWIDLTVTDKVWSYEDTRELADGNYTYMVRVKDDAGNTSATAQQVVTVDTTPPETHGQIAGYTDDQGERQGANLSADFATDDTAPVINGSLNQPLADGEIAELYRDGKRLGQLVTNGTTSWTFNDSGLTDGNHSYIVRITDRAGNYVDSEEWVLKVDTTVPTTVAKVTDLTTTDTTPIISGELNAALKNGEYLTVTVNGKTYTSEKGGAVVVDPDSHTWYLQVPDFDALAVKAGGYDVATLVRSSAGNGNTTGTLHGNLTITEDASMVPAWKFTTAGSAYTGAFTLNDDGLWTILSNQQIASSSGQNSYTVSSNFDITGSYTSGTFADINRDGLSDILAMGTSYSTMRQLTNDGNGTYENITIPRSNMGADIWYGSIVAIDFQGDGYLDFIIGDAGNPSNLDSSTLFRNTNGTLNGESTSTANTKFKADEIVGNYTSGIEVSGVDLNNDGKVDIVLHTSNVTSGGKGDYSLSTMFNQGNGSFKWGQNFINTMYSGGGSGAADNAVSMTWADFNGDGSMDLFMGMTRSSTVGGLMLNDKSGNLGALQAIGTANSDKFGGNVSIAVDWNHDGKMDIIKLATTTQSYLYTNGGIVNNNLSFTASKFGDASSSRVASAALVDYDWDGKQDLLIMRQNGKVELQRNTNDVADGTAIHLKIVDSQGINAYFGNTVKLYDSNNQLVSAQVLNAQSGMGINDSSALLSFYGLKADEIYRAEMVYQINGVPKTTTWDGLTAGAAHDNYAVTAEAGTGKHEGTLTGTGYNDTFIADTGTYTYKGAGGWESQSDHETWSATGGMDIVDFRNSTVGITADLSKGTAQSTGYNTSTFTDIEGIAGSAHDDVITGNSGNNLFEGRGGNDTFNIGNGGHDTLLYKLINAADATGGNGHDTVNGFTVGTWEGTADSDRIDLRELLSDSGYTGTGSAHYVDGVATLDASAGNILDFIKVTTDGSSTTIHIDRDGSGGNFNPTDVVTLNGVQTDLATLLANHQLLVV
ncbi:Ig-like domain-containing protein [Pluralibacter gergoviae]|uniref:Ig-like domain-containing protein n=1 Tax=Pluralibacter gergoviae TaxID=61647 RepID=UPI0021F3F01C|nr:Ig-like domain-containing protein [Pluralibacter gergoviae]MCV7760176.1 Ig-like domain-containing protein [Pluralibacter gergoviae]